MPTGWLSYHVPDGAKQRDVCAQLAHAASKFSCVAMLRLELQKIEMLSGCSTFRTIEHSSHCQLKVALQRSRAKKIATCKSMIEMINHAALVRLFVVENDSMRLSAL